VTRKVVGVSSVFFVRRPQAYLIDQAALKVFLYCTLKDEAGFDLNRRMRALNEQIEGTRSPAAERHSSPGTRGWRQMTSDDDKRKRQRSEPSSVSSNSAPFQKQRPFSKFKSSVI
jgi:hypothetical protein